MERTMPKVAKEEANKPVDKFTDGRVHVSIWENTGVTGAFRTATFQLRYKDHQKEWQTGHSFGASDLNHMENAAKEARTRIENWQKANRSEEKPRSAA
jgi:hypothetical protein